MAKVWYFSKVSAFEWASGSVVALIVAGPDTMITTGPVVSITIREEQDRR